MATRLLRLCSWELRGGELVVHCCSKALGDGRVCFFGWVGGAEEFERMKALFALRGKGEWELRMLLSYKMSCL